MKLLLSIFLLCSGGAFAAHPPVQPGANVLIAFSETFGAPEGVRWEAASGDWVAAFIKDSVRTNIRYDRRGRFLSSRRYYQQQGLPLNILLKLKAQYRGMTIGVVTEVIVESETFYFMSLEDGKHLFRVSLDANGDTIEISKWEQAS